MIIMPIQFEPPFNGTCARHQGLLYKLGGGRPAFIDFKQEGLSEIPKVIIIEGMRFEFKGVSEGQAIYREEKVSFDYDTLEDSLDDGLDYIRGYEGDR